MTYLFEFHRRASTWSWMIYPRERKYLWDYPFALVRISTKMNSLYQIRSKMLHGTKVIILVEKNRKKDGLAGIRTRDLHIRSRKC